MGKFTTRSYNRGGGGASAINLLVPDLHLSGLRVRKTCLANPSTNDPVAAYGIQSLGAGGGTNLIENCYVDYGAKHAFGFTDNDLARQTTVLNCPSRNNARPMARSPAGWIIRVRRPREPRQQRTRIA